MFKKIISTEDGPLQYLTLFHALHLYDSEVPVFFQKTESLSPYSVCFLQENAKQQCSLDVDGIGPVLKELPPNMHKRKIEEEMVGLPL